MKPLISDHCPPQSFDAAADRRPRAKLRAIGARLLSGSFAAEATGGKVFGSDCRKPWASVSASPCPSLRVSGPVARGCRVVGGRFSRLVEA